MVDEGVGEVGGTDVRGAVDAGGGVDAGTVADGVVTGGVVVVGALEELQAIKTRLTTKRIATRRPSFWFIHTLLERKYFPCF